MKEKERKAQEKPIRLEVEGRRAAEERKKWEDNVFGSAYGKVAYF